MSARLGFLARIEQQQRERSVLADLRETLWPLYQGKWQYDPRPDWYPMSLAVLEARRKRAGYKQIYQALVEWGQRCNLCRDGVGEWTLQTALDTLHQWGKSPKKPGPLRFFLPDAGGVALLTDEEQSFRFDHEGWDPEQSSRSKFETHIKEKFNDDLERYGDHIQELASQRGSEPASRKREGAKHMDWLVPHQIEREPIKAIADSRPKHTKEAVKNAVYSLRDLIELPRGKRGAPRKKRVVSAPGKN